MRLETDRLVQNQLRLSREERDHMAGHALDSIKALAEELAWSIGNEGTAQGVASTCSRKIAALSNLLGDIGWEREAGPVGSQESRDQSRAIEGNFVLGQLFPVAQIRPWLEEWQRQDNEALIRAEEALREAEKTWSSDKMQEPERAIKANLEIKLGTGAILLARIEKWMASHGN